MMEGSGVVDGLKLIKFSDNNFCEGSDMASIIAIHSLLLHGDEASGLETSFIQILSSQ